MATDSQLKSIMLPFEGKKRSGNLIFRISKEYYFLFRKSVLFVVPEKEYSMFCCNPYESRFSILWECEKYFLKKLKLNEIREILNKKILGISQDQHEAEVMERIIMQEINRTAFNPVRIHIISQYMEAVKHRTNIPDDFSYIKAMKIADILIYHYELMKYVCCLADGGFSFRLQRDDSKYLDIDIYNGDRKIVLLYADGDKREAYDFLPNTAIMKIKEWINSA